MQREISREDLRNLLKVDAVYGIMPCWSPCAGSPCGCGWESLPLSTTATLSFMPS
ncbi:MAG: hypothetical protein R3F26_04330 [Gammaproteobacteria bacterium]